MYQNIDIILNPSSGKQRFQDNIKEIKRMLEKDGATVEIFYTEKKYDAEKFAMNSCKATTDLIVSVGGDGTLNEVINGMMKSERRVPLAIYPTGTANDFASYFNISTKVQNFYQMIQRQEEKQVDVGKANDRYFINVVAGGKITEVAHRVSSDKKTILGRMAYLFEGARDFPSQIFKPVQIKYTIDGKTEEKEVLFFLISNTTYVGGFKQLMNQAETDDGKFDLLMAEKIPITEFINVFIKAMNGTHINHPKIYYKKVDNFEVEADPAMEIDIDGEYLGKTPVKVSIEHKAVTILIPR